MNLTANVFLRAMADAFMRCEVPTNAAVNVPLIGHEAAIPRGVAIDHRGQIRRGNIGDVEAKAK
jgi:hypothetical protein